MKTFAPCPPEIYAAIVLAECARLDLTADECFSFDAHIGYVPDYCTDSIGYHGPVVVILWPADPGAVTTYYLRDGAWTLCNHSSW